MSYRLIDANALNGKISEEDYEVVLDAPCVYVDLPNGLDGGHYEVYKWISVDERLPEVSGEYLVKSKDERGVFHTWLDWFYEGLGIWSHKNLNIVAWMPLPKFEEGGAQCR